MNQIEAAAVDDIIGWDTGTWSHALDFWKPVLDFCQNGEIAVEIGARTGGLSLLFALSGMNAISTDLDNPAEFGRSIHSKYDLRGNIDYVVANAMQLPIASGIVSVVGSKSVLGSIARDGNIFRAQRAVDEAYRVLKPGGALLFAENLRATGLHMMLRKRFVSWASHYLYFSPLQLDTLLSQFSEVKYETRGFTALTGRNEWQRRALAKFDRVVHPVTPSGWRYLAYGYARK